MRNGQPAARNWLLAGVLFGQKIPAGPPENRPRSEPAAGFQADPGNPENSMLFFHTAQPYGAF